MFLYALYLFLCNLVKSFNAGLKAIYRSVNKTFQRKTSNLCELQRIIYSTLSGYERTSQVEKSLDLSKNTYIKAVYRQIFSLIEKHDFEYKTRLILIPKLITEIAKQKGITLNLHPKFVPAMRECLISITGLRLLRQKVYKWQHTPFKMGDIEDEDKLRYIWSNLMEEQLSGISSKQWGELGFQGVHPCTDLRGVGMLGLYSLMYLIQEHRAKAKEFVSLSRHPKYGYPFGILSINITFLACEILESSAGVTHFYNKFDKFQIWHEQAQYSSDNLLHNVGGDHLMAIFYEFYSALLYKFNKFWFKQQPENIMEFPRIMKKFKEWLQTELKEPKCVIECSLQQI